MMRAALCSVLALGLGACAQTDIAGDAGLIDARPGDGETGESWAPEIYDTSRTLSPITPRVARHLRDIFAQGAGLDSKVFAKVGDSATVSINFLHCFDSGYVDPRPDEQHGSIDLDGRDELRPTIALFGDGNAAGTDPFERASLAAGVGFTADSVLAGNPAPVEREYAAISPHFAVIMLGTEDIETDSVDTYGSHLLELVDRSIAAGIIPIMTSIMPRDDSAVLDAGVLRYNAVIRGVAQARQVPFIDLHRELAVLPDHGLGPDGVHPSVYREGEVALPCAFHAQGLSHGYNVRNLLTIQTLHRLAGVVIHGEDAPDAPVRSIQGAGTAQDPFVIAELPFTHVADTAVAGSRTIDRYDGCAATQNESGPEIMYRLDVDSPMRIRAMLVDRGSADIDVHLLEGGTGGESCITRAHQTITAELESGTYYLSLDTFASSDGEHAGEYLLAIMSE